MSKLSKKVILITGGNGMVASQTDFGIKLNREELNITIPRSIERAIKKYRPSAILHLAALTNMKECEKNPRKAEYINVIGTQNLAKRCKIYGIKMAYMSTCAVFDGKKKTPYTENDQPNPLNVYGKTKRQGELEMQKILPDALIIRTGWLFGGGKGVDTKFIFSTLTKMQNGENIQAVNDRFGSPTYVPDLLKKTEELINKKAKGIFHVVNFGAASYFDIAKEIKKVGKFSSEIMPIAAKNFENPLVKRGTMEALTSKKVKLRLWKTALLSYFKKLDIEH